MSIEQKTFDAVADRTLHALESALCDIDGLEVDLQSGVLAIEFADGESFVVNSHGAARQIWMAAGAIAWHFGLDAETGRWKATKTGEDLWACLAEKVGAKLGRHLAFDDRG
jgi:CyaY protein